jgi:transcriptional regulator NrdR family protein
MQGERGKLSPPCPFCGSTESLVVDSRWHVQSFTKRRTRQCSSCAKRFSTEERPIERQSPPPSR